MIKAFDMLRKFKGSKILKMLKTTVNIKHDAIQCSICTREQHPTPVHAEIAETVTPVHKCTSQEFSTTSEVTHVKLVSLSTSFSCNHK